MTSDSIDRAAHLDTDVLGVRDLEVVVGALPAIEALLPAGLASRIADLTSSLDGALTEWLRAAGQERSDAADTKATRRTTTEDAVVALAGINRSIGRFAVRHSGMEFAVVNNPHPADAEVPGNTVHALRVAAPQINDLLRALTQPDHTVHAA